MSFTKLLNGKVKNYIAVSLLFILCGFVIMVNLQKRDDEITYDKFGSSIRDFNSIMANYNWDMIDAKNIDEKVKVIKDLGIKIDSFNISFSSIEERFDLSFQPLGKYINSIDLNKFKEDSTYYTETINTLDKICSKSAEISEMDYKNFYKYHNSKILRLKPSDKIVDYFSEINELVATKK